MTEEVYLPLKDIYDFRCRGRVSVKGKGEMITYFLLSRKPLEVGPLGCSSSGPFSDRRSPISPDSPSLVRPSSRQSWDSGHIPRQGSGTNLRQGSLSSQGKGQGYGTLTGLDRPPSLDSGRGNLGTPTGSLNKKRQSSLDSPRNTSRNLSGSSGANSLCNEGQVREHPELPAIHYMNIKMHNNSTGVPPVRQNMVQNALFDSLKETNSSPVSPPHSVASSPSSLSTNGGSVFPHSQFPPSGMYPLKAADSNADHVSQYGRQTPNPSTAAKGTVAAVQPIRRVNSDLAAKPPTPPTSFSSPSNLSQLQMLGNSGGHYQLVRPSGLGLSAGSLSPKQPALKPVQEDVIPEDPVLAYNQDNKLPVKDLPAKQLVPAGCPYQPQEQNSPVRSSLKSASSSNRSSASPTSDVNNQECRGGNGCSSNPTPQPQPQPQSPDRNDDGTEDRFVTGVYREPIDRSHSAAPSQTSSTSSGKAGSQTNTAVTGLKTNSPSVTKTPVRPLSDVLRRSSSGSKESNSSGSTLTPSTSALVVSIDGKMMSILPQGEELPLALRRVNADDLNVATNGMRSDFDKNRIMLSPKSKRQSFPTYPYMKRDLTSYSSFTTSEDEKDSISSKQMSDHSSIVLLQPIHLKPSRAANVRHLHAFEDKSDADLLNYIFGSPFHSLDRYKSRSSDTINSIPRCPPTPKFPIPTPDSSSLTQLLQELAGESSAVPQEITPSPRCKREAGPEAGSRPHGAGPANASRDVALTQGPLAEVKRQWTNRHSAQPVSRGGAMGVGHRVPLISQYQVKRRSAYTMPPRHCRSLDYIPSDREDGSHISSNTSSACGSPRVQQRHSYLLPLIFGRHHAPPTNTDNVSMSSLASSSEMSRSDPAINAHDSSSAAYESEYDNYRPGMTSDEDFYLPDPISDADVDLLDVDDLNVEDVTVSDHFSLDMPVPRFQKKKITDV